MVIKRFRRVRRDIIIDDDENYAKVITKHLRELRVNEETEVKLKNINRLNGNNDSG